MRQLQVALFLLFTVFTGCSSNGTTPRAFQSPWKSTGKVKVLTSIVPVYCLTKQIAGDDAEVLCLMVSHGPHDFEPTHDDVKILAEADLFVVIGMGLEEFLNGMVKNADNRNLNVVRTGLAMPREMRLEADGKPHYHGKELVTHKGTDPHIWLGMDEAGHMVDAISEALIQRDSKHADDYKKRTVELKQRLIDLKARGREQLKSAKGGSSLFMIPSAISADPLALPSWEPFEM